MLTRENELNTWLNRLFNHDTYTLSPLAGDASFRRYYRIHHESASYIVMDAPPQQEGLSAFIAIARQFASFGVRTPNIFNFNLETGFVLLEDFGDTLLLDEAHSTQIAQHYQAAMQVLSRIQQCPTTSLQLTLFDEPCILRELKLFQGWFLETWLGLRLSSSEQRLLNQTFEYLVQAIITQPQCLVHCDYHARNLSLIGQKQTSTIGVLDFQDAKIGPFTYDLVSLLKDAYIEWPHEKRIQWLNDFYQMLPNQQGWSRDAFERGFHLCGLQRHLKILGIFCRLQVRDGKPRYLKDLPLTYRYILESLANTPSLELFYDFMETRVSPLVSEKAVA